MRLKKLNSMQDCMNILTCDCVDILSQLYDDIELYSMVKDWFSDCVLMYALTICTGNDTYIKSCKSVFDTHIVKSMPEYIKCSGISETLSEMVACIKG